MDIVTLGLARRFTRDTAISFGAVIGAPCTIKKTEHKNGQTIVTFEWTATTGEKKETQIFVEDGTNIYPYQEGTTYHYGDLIIYASQFYRCVVENSSSPFNELEWNAIGTPDGNFGISQSYNTLPARFTSADRKLYFSIEDGFFYLWDGEKWAEQQPKSITIQQIDDLFDF